jgi:hypothetical protein
MSVSSIRQRLAPRSLRNALILAAAALAFSVLPVAAAHASYYLDTSSANALAADFVAQHYADTYVADLTTQCRPQYHRFAAPGYVYHRWTCKWWDSSDGTSGRVLIVGSRGAGRYYGAVLNGARG